ncbi:MAG: hypothetical protein ACKO8Q_06645 [Bacteroidota bacterium]
MPTTKKHIIVVNYDFPPNKGIGGRRWAKLAKAFADREYIVHVIKADSVSDTETSIWSDEVRHNNIQIYSLPRKYPNILLSNPLTLIDKIKYRTSIRYISKKHKGTPYDISLGWEDLLWEKLNEITKNNSVEWIFATGAPWDLLRVCAAFKMKYNHLKLWIDLRDPWLNARNYGMPNLSLEKRKEEEAKAHFTIQGATVISAPAIEIFNPFIERKWLEQNDQKIFHLKHFYSEKRMDIRNSPRNTQSIQLVYGGEIYLDTEKYFLEIVNDLEKLRLEHPKKYQELSIQIHSSSSKKIEKIVSKHPNIQVFDTIGKSIERKISHAQWCIILLAEHNQDFFTTKYFEYQQLGVPYLFIGPESSMVRSQIINDGRGTDWKTFFAQCMKGEYLDHTLYTQKISEKDNVDFRILEIEEKIDSFK